MTDFRFRFFRVALGVGLLLSLSAHAEKGAGPRVPQRRTFNVEAKNDAEKDKIRNSVNLIHPALSRDVHITENGGKLTIIYSPERLKDELANSRGLRITAHKDGKEIGSFLERPIDFLKRGNTGNREAEVTVEELDAGLIQILRGELTLLPRSQATPATLQMERDRVEGREKQVANFRAAVETLALVDQAARRANDHAVIVRGVRPPAPAENKVPLAARLVRLEQFLGQLKEKLKTDPVQYYQVLGDIAEMLKSEPKTAEAMLDSLTGRIEKILGEKKRDISKTQEALVKALLEFSRKGDEKLDKTKERICGEIKGTRPQKSCSLLRFLLGCS